MASNDTQPELAVAIIGTGFMAAVHVEALRRVGLGVTVRGILGSTPEKSAAAARRLGLARAYRSLDELLADRDVAAVHVNSPNVFHLQQASAAIRAGKHVLCEKPLAMTAAETRELVSLAHAHRGRLVCGVNYNNRFYPLVHEARERVRSGAVGRLYHINGSVAQEWLSRPTDYNWRVLAEQGGTLRALSDIGSHWLDLVQFITGRHVTAVCAHYVTVHPQRIRPEGEVETFSNRAAAGTPVPITTDDYGAVLLKFDGGLVGSFWVSQVSPGRKYSVRFELAGERETLAWDSEDPERMWVGRRPTPDDPPTATSGLLRRDPGQLYPAAARVSDYPGGHAEGYPDSFKQCFRSFYRYIRTGDFSTAPDFATFDDGHRDVVMVDAFVESRRRGGWVEVGR
ncbi:MAG: Gfo/Idh/MocA family protein [Tepidisphaerales bacterium]